VTGELMARSWRPGDEDAFTPRADFLKAANLQPFNDETARRTLAYTLVRDTEPEVVLGIAGLTCIEPDGWRLWARTADLRPREWAQAGVLTGHVLDWFHRTLPQARVSASAADAVSRRYLEALGFVLLDGDEMGLDGAIYRILERAA